MITYQELTDQSVNNLINSLMVPKLVEAINSGSDDLVESALKLLMSCLDASSSRPDLLVHILRSGFVKAVYNRTSALKWRSPKTKSREIRKRQDTKRPHTLTATNLSLTSQRLFRNFSQALIQISNFDMEDSQRSQLLYHLVPLFHQLLSCPDTKVLNNTLNCFVTLIKKNDQNRDLIVSLVNNFGQTLMAMISSKDETVVLTIMQFINTIIESYPELVFAEEFGSQLMIALNLLNDKNSQKLNKEGIVLLLSVGQWIDIRDDKSRQLSDRLLYLSLIMLKRSASCNQYNIQSALLAFETLLAKYPFQSFVEFIVRSSESRGILRQMLVTNDQTIAEIMTKVFGQIQSIINANQLINPEGALIARRALFDGLNTSFVVANLMANC